MSRSVTQLLLALVLAAHSSELVRFGFMTLNLAPDCPVVGNTRSSTDNNPAHATHANHLTSSHTDDHHPTNNPSDSDPDRKNTDPSDHCRTCVMLAVWRTFFTDFQDTQIDSLRRVDASPPLHNLVTASLHHSPAQGRAPPIA